MCLPLFAYILSRLFASFFHSCKNFLLLTFLKSYVFKSKEGIDLGGYKYVEVCI